jgi:hypothetical protein
MALHRGRLQLGKCARRRRRRTHAPAGEFVVLTSRSSVWRFRGTISVERADAIAIRGYVE